MKSTLTYTVHINKDTKFKTTDALEALEKLNLYKSIGMKVHATLRAFGKTKLVNESFLTKVAYEFKA